MGLSTELPHVTGVGGPRDTETQTQKQGDTEGTRPDGSHTLEVGLRSDIPQPLPSSVLWERAFRSCPHLGGRDDTKLKPREVGSRGPLLGTVYPGPRHLLPREAPWNVRGWAPCTCCGWRPPGSATGHGPRRPHRWPVPPTASPDRRTVLSALSSSPGGGSSATSARGRARSGTCQPNPGSPSPQVTPSVRRLGQRRPARSLRPTPSPGMPQGEQGDQAWPLPLPHQGRGWAPVGARSGTGPPSRMRGGPGAGRQGEPTSALPLPVPQRLQGQQDRVPPRSSQAFPPPGLGEPPRPGTQSFRGAEPVHVV